MSNDSVTAYFITLPSPTPVCLSDLFEGSPSVARLRGSDILARTMTDTTLEGALVCDCQHIDLTACRNITLTSLAFPPSLSVLILTGCMEVSEKVITSLPPTLTTLSLSGVPCVTNKTLASLATNLPKITSLDISGARRVTDDGVAVFFAETGHRLRSLSLSGCVAITDIPPTPMPFLTNLNLANCKKITDATLGNTAELCPVLERIELSFCANVTETGFLVFAEKTKTTLRFVDLEFCLKVSDAVVGLCPWLVVKGKG